MKLRYLVGENNPRYGKPPTTFNDVTGQKFGKLTVLSYTVTVGFLCLCECGNEHTEIGSYDLRKGKRVSCGHCNGKRTDHYLSWEDKFLISKAGILTLTEIGTALNRSMSSVQTRGRLLRKKGLLKKTFQRYGERHHCSKFSDEDVELVRALREEGLLVRVIADKMEMPYQWVGKICIFIARCNDPVKLNNTSVN